MDRYAATLPNDLDAAQNVNLVVGIFVLVNCNGQIEPIRYDTRW